CTPLHGRRPSKLRAFHRTAVDQRAARACLSRHARYDALDQPASATMCRARRTGAPRCTTRTTAYALCCTDSLTYEVVSMKLSIAVSLVAIASSAAAVAQMPKFMGGPVTIEDQGSFFIGGVPKISEHASIPFAPPGQQPPPRTPQQITIGQMYVQFQVPADRAGPGWPVIMVHGSTHTGAALESTPDGREGWYPYFVRRGIPTYVVDQSGRGRSGFDQSVLHEAEALL